MFWIAFIFAFVSMELAAWAAHRFLMHGPLWWLHRDHHRPGPGFFERNDWFFIFFAVPSSLSIHFGLHDHVPAVAGFGFGILAFGFAYVLVHEIIIHRRVKWFKNPRRGYLGAIVRRHRLHHQRADREDGRFFGMLWAPPRDWT